MGPIYFGLDFGTSNCNLAFVYDDPRERDSKTVRVQEVEFVNDAGAARSKRLPAIVSAHFDDKRIKRPLVGWEFEAQFAQQKRNADLLRHGRSFFSSVKSDLGSYKLYVHAFSNEFRTPEAVARALVDRMFEEAARILPDLDTEEAYVFVTVPASLGATARKETLDAVISTGIPKDHIDLIDEPVAAIADVLNSQQCAAFLDDTDPSNVLIFDYGGGTLDLSLVSARFDDSRESGLAVQNRAISGYLRHGGDCIDVDIMDQIVWPRIEAALTIDQDEIDRPTRRAIEDTLTCTVARSLKERMCFNIEQTDSARRDGYSRKVPKANVALSRVFALKDLDGKLPKRFEMSHEEFCDVMAPYLADPESDEKSLLAPVFEVLERAGLEPRQLDAVVLHGGGCRNPLVRPAIESALAENDLFGAVQIVQTSNLDTSVARGAAVACYWKHVRDDILIEPIIAEEIGILTLNDQPVRLVDAGTPLPFPDDGGVYTVPDEFFVPRAGQREMIVPFYTGDSRNPGLSGSIPVDLPTGVRKGDAVTIKLRITTDKLFHWWYQVGDGESWAAESIDDPWSQKVASPQMRRVYEHRKMMRLLDEIEPGMADQMVLEEGHLLYAAEQYDEAELLLLDYAEHDPNDVNAANLLGLMYERIGDNENALVWHKRAAELAPENAICVGNYGLVLADHGSGEEAIPLMRRALSIDPKLGYLYMGLGNLWRKEGNERDALKEFKEAIRLYEKETGGNPENAELWNRLAAAYQAIGEYEKAHDASRRAVNLDANARFGGDHTLRIAGPDSGF